MQLGLNVLDGLLGHVAASRALDEDRTSSVMRDMIKS